MVDAISLPPIGFQPDDLNFYLTVFSPPFQWILKRGEGWVYLSVSLPFKDGKSRDVEVVIGKYPTYTGYLVDVRLSSDLLLELGLVNDVTPMVGRFDTFPPQIGKVI